jgi:hypothetical protein
MWGESSYTVGDSVKVVQPLWKSVGSFLEKLKMDVCYDQPTKALLDIDPKKCKSV